MKGIPMPARSCEFVMAYMKWWIRYKFLCSMVLKSNIAKLASLMTWKAMPFSHKKDLWIKHIRGH